MAEWRTQGAESEARLEVAPPPWTVGVIRFAMVAVGVVCVPALLFSGILATAIGSPFVGFGLLGSLRLLHERIVFRRDSVVYRGSWMQCSVPVSRIERLWFLSGGGTVMLQLAKASIAQFHVGERAVGTDLAAKRSAIASALIDTLGQGYAGIVAFDPPTGVRYRRLVSLSRLNARFAPLLPSEWAVVVATLAATTIATVATIIPQFRW